MCEHLAAVKEALCRYASAFDPSVVSPADASVVVQLAAAVEASASALKALAAVRAAEGGSWRSSGHRSPAEELAAATGTTVGAAKETLSTGQALSGKPKLREAATSGELSREKANALAGAGDAAEGLVEPAKQASLADVRRDAAKARLESVGTEARRREVHRRRHLRSWTDDEGAWHLRGQGCLEDGAQVMSVLGPLADARFQEARRAGEREHPDAYRYDAFLDLFRRLAAGGPGLPDEPDGPAGASPPGPGPSGPAGPSPAPTDPAGPSPAGTPAAGPPPA